MPASSAFRSESRCTDSFFFPPRYSSPDRLITLSTTIIISDLRFRSPGFGLFFGLLLSFCFRLPSIAVRVLAPNAFWIFYSVFSVVVSWMFFNFLFLVFFFLSLLLYVYTSHASRTTEIDVAASFLYNTKCQYELSSRLTLVLKTTLYINIMDVDPLSRRENKLFTRVMSKIVIL